LWPPILLLVLSCNPPVLWGFDWKQLLLIKYPPKFQHCWIPTLSWVENFFFLQSKCSKFNITFQHSYYNLAIHAYTQRIWFNRLDWKIHDLKSIPISEWVMKQVGERFYYCLRLINPQVLPTISFCNTTSSRPNFNITEFQQLRTSI
jgi:hypothetical protein